MTDQDSMRGPEGDVPQDEALDHDLTDILDALRGEDAEPVGNGPASSGSAPQGLASDKPAQSEPASAESADTPSAPSELASTEPPDTAPAPTKPKWRLFGKRPEPEPTPPTGVEGLGPAEQPTMVLPVTGEPAAADTAVQAHTPGATDARNGSWMSAEGAEASEEPLWATGAFGAVGPLEVGATCVIPASAEVPRNVDMGPAKPGRWWMWALAVVTVLAVLGVAGYAWWWTTSREIIVPDIVGKKPAEATQTLNDVGLRLGKVSEIPTDSAPVGTIISQKPEAGTRLKPADVLSFVIAASPEQTKVPAVVGVSAEQAAETLVQARLRPLEVESFNATVAAGFVVAQLPDQGLELVPGTTVALVVSKGPAPTSTTVPRISGMEEGDAVTLLEAVGLQARVYRTPDASVTAGVVNGQTPQHGTAAAPNSVVQVLVSQGSATTSVTVPSVTGQTRKSAVAEIKAKGLVVQVIVVSNATIAKGRVISQMPPAGGRSAAKGTVGLLVSRGNVNDGPVPSVVGTASAEASTAVSAAGFSPVFVTVGVEGHTPDTVFAQYPGPGLTHPFRFPMVCLVAKAPGL